MESSMAGMVPPLGPLPGTTPTSANTAGVARAGAKPWPLITETLPALAS